MRLGPHEQGIWFSFLILIIRINNGKAIMNQNEKFIRRLETYDNESSVVCPACNHVVLSHTEENDGPSPCKHTLFIATDHGFEYRNERFDSIMGIQGVKSEELEIEDNNFDAYTDRVPLPNSLKYGIYTPAPGCLGAYIGFELVK